jgi:hypothetical protein
MNSTYQPCNTGRRRLLSGAAAGIATALITPWAWAAQAGYSKRAISIIENAGAIDMLGLVTINNEEWDRWNSANGMTEADRQQFKDCGIKVFHHSFGMGGPNSHTMPSSISRGSTPSSRATQTHSRG